MDTTPLRREDIRRSILYSVRLVNDEYKSRARRVKELEDGFDHLLFANTEQAEAKKELIQMHRARMSRLLDALVNLARACKTICGFPQENRKFDHPKRI